MRSHRPEWWVELAGGKRQEELDGKQLQIPGNTESRLGPLPLF